MPVARPGHPAGARAGRARQSRGRARGRQPAAGAAEPATTDAARARRRRRTRVRPVGDRAVRPRPTPSARRRARAGDRARDDRGGAVAAGSPTGSPTSWCAARSMTGCPACGAPSCTCRSPRRSSAAHAEGADGGSASWPTTSRPRRRWTGPQRAIEYSLLAGARGARRRWTSTRPRPASAAALELGHRRPAPARRDCSSSSARPGSAPGARTTRSRRSATAAQIARELGDAELLATRRGRASRRRAGGPAITDAGAVELLEEALAGAAATRTPSCA